MQRPGFSLTSPARLPDWFTALAFGLAATVTDFTMTWLARPFAPTESSSRYPHLESLCYGLAVPFPLLSTTCRHAAIKVLYPQLPDEQLGKQSDCVFFRVIVFFAWAGRAAKSP